MQAIPNVYGKLSFASAVRPPNPDCLVCGHAVACVSVDMQTFTLQRLVEGVLKKRMAFNHPMIVADDFLYEEGDDLDDDEVEDNARHLPCVLAKLPGGLEHNARLHVTDQSQNMKLTLVLQQAVRACVDEWGCILPAFSAVGCCLNANAANAANAASEAVGHVFLNHEGAAAHHPQLSP